MMIFDPYRRVPAAPGARAVGADVRRRKRRERVQPDRRRSPAIALRGAGPGCDARRGPRAVSERVCATRTTMSIGCTVPADAANAGLIENRLTDPGRYTLLGRSTGFDHCCEAPGD